MKRYWLVYWVEKYSDGTVNKFKTAVKCETAMRAAAVAESELRFRTDACGTEFLITGIGLADKNVADLMGKAECDASGVEWPE